MIDSQKIKKVIKSDSELRVFFYDVLYTTLITGDPHKMRPLNLSLEKVGFKEYLLQSAEIFVLGHEFGHINRGHFDIKSMVNAQFGGRKLKINSKSWQQEFAADLSGFEYVTAMGTKDPFEISVSYCGASLFLTCQDIIERALLRLTSEDNHRTGSDTHPPPNLRRAALDDIFRTLVGFRNANATIKIYEETIAYILCSLWKAVSDEWGKLKDNKVVPHKIWRNSVESMDRDNSSDVKPKKNNLFPFELVQQIETNIEEFKPECFLILLHLYGTKANLANEAASILKNSPPTALAIAYSLFHEIAKGNPERANSLIDHILVGCPSLNRPICETKFIITRYSYLDNVMLANEVTLHLVTFVKFLELSAENILTNKRQNLTTLYLQAQSAHSKNLGSKLS